MFDSFSALEDPFWFVGSELDIASADAFLKALTQEHSNEMADGIASILGEEMQELEKRQHSGLVAFPSLTCEFLTRKKCKTRIV